MQRLGVLLFLIILAVHQYWSQRSVNHPDGILIATEPQQKNLSEPFTVFKYKEATITKMAEYKLEARVLSTERYWLGKMAKLAPVDVAVGWQEMSDTSVIKNLKINQADRFYFYQWKNEAPVDSERIKITSANMHLIPANQFIEDEIKHLRVGQMIKLSGQLVNLQLPDGQALKTSVRRDDSGPGACEIMWVENIELIK